MALTSRGEPPSSYSTAVSLKHFRFHGARPNDGKLDSALSCASNIGADEELGSFTQLETNLAAGTEAAAATQCLVFTRITLELGLVPPALYARNR